MPSMHASERRRRILTGLAALLLALMAVLHLAQTKVRVDAKAKEEEGARPKARGRSYEAHVLSRENLPADVAGAGGRLQAHPVIRPAQVELEGAYFTQPKGFADGKATPVEGFAKAPATWRALGRGGYRIPDAIIHEAGGGETLVEIKCPSPWLVFDEESKWAGRMQMAFGSQALAFATWATEGSQREVRYLFCGLVPPWAASILAHVGEQRGVPVKLEQGAYAGSYPPVQRFLLSTAADLLTAATLGAVANLPLVDLQGAAYDGVED